MLYKDVSSWDQLCLLLDKKLIKAVVVDFVPIIIITDVSMRAKIIKIVTTNKVNSNKLRQKGEPRGIN